MKKGIKKKKNILKYLGFLILAFSLVLNFFLFQKSQSQEKLYKVKEIIDGDTFVLEDDIIVRLFRIETPELDLCGGPEAKEYLEGLLTGEKVSLENKYRDQYGRLIALVFLEDGKLVNEQILLSGWGRYDEMKFEYNERLNEAQEKAEIQKVGIFSHLCLQFENPVNPKCRIKGNIAKRGKAKTYHFPGCGRYDDFPVELDSGDQWFCTEKEAREAGFVKSKNCFDKKYEAK